MVKKFLKILNFYRSKSLAKNVRKVLRPGTKIFEKFDFFFVTYKIEKMNSIVFKIDFHASKFKIVKVKISKN